MENNIETDILEIYQRLIDKLRESDTIGKAELSIIDRIIAIYRLLKTKHKTKKLKDVQTFVESLQ